MTKSENAWEHKEEPETVWEFIQENPLLLGLPLSESKGIDLLSALRDIYETNKKDQKAAQMLLTMLANVLVASAQGDGEEVVEEVIIQDAMLEFDTKLKGVLDEGH
jgi:hypothetical protein